MSFYLAFKEIWRNKGRFMLFSMVIALITVLVLFIAALAEGLATANKEYISKLNAQLLVFQENTDYSTTASRLAYNKINSIRRVPGIADVGPIGFANGTLIFADGREDVDIALIGVEPRKPGEPPVLQGRGIRSRGYEAILDGKLASEQGIALGDEIVIKTIQGTEDEFYTIKIIGITDGQQYFFQPAVFVPFQTWDKIRPQPATGQSDLVANVMAVRLQNPADWQAMAQTLQAKVSGVEATDLKTAYESAPGYQAQQSTLNTQQAFTLLIGVLVIGGFFQIQTLQKVPQIGMLKAIGTSNHTVAVAVVTQIILVTLFGVFIGTITTLGLAFGLPSSVPIIFSGQSAAFAIVALSLIGPIGGMVSVRLALKVEPLRALGM
ncbi:MAG: ABC transporter permease [Anaerolineales bacterium]